MLEGVTLTRKLGRNPALAQFLELEIFPGAAVGDDQLADAIASNLASYGHPVATAPMGGPQDPWSVVDSHGAVKGIDGLRVVDASIMPVVVSVALNPTTIMIAERIARAVYGSEPGPLRRGVSGRRKSSESGDDDSPDRQGLSSSPAVRSNRKEAPTQ
jgi:choline dehydrogenase